MVTKDDRKQLSSFSLQNFKEGGETMDFDYFYNREAEGFNFLKVPEKWKERSFKDYPQKLFCSMTCF